MTIEDRIVELNWLIGELENTIRPAYGDKTLLRNAKRELRSLGVKVDKDY